MPQGLAPDSPADPPFHPVADIFPLMAEHELAELAEDIREHGQREPIYLHEGQIVDGRNRYLACRRAEVPPEFQEWDGGDGSLVSFVVSMNLRRRHLNESQRQVVAAKIATLAKGQRPRRLADVPTQAEAATLLNVGERGVRRARVVLGHAVPALREAVERGEIGLTAAAVVAGLPEKQQAEIIAEGPKAVQREAKMRRERSPKERQLAPRPASDAMEIAGMAIGQLERIRDNDPARLAALRRIGSWVGEQLSRKPWWLSQFLAELRDGGRRERAAELAGVSLECVANHEARDPEIASATAGARADWLAGEKRRRRAAARRARAGLVARAS